MATKAELERLLAELTSRKVKKFVLEEYLFDKQLEFVRDPAPFKCAVTTRRSGKSTSCVADLINEALTTPVVNVLYITLSRKNAKKLVWPEFKRINRNYELNGIVNESDLTITFPNESVIYLSGASDRGDIENFRGMALKKVYIDEGQSFPGYIRELIDEVLGPALMDYSGSLCLIGTPGPIPTGYFYEVSQSKEWSQHFWSAFDNPHLAKKSGKTVAELLDRELKRRGVQKDDPSIQREWFGRWVLDSDSLVFKFGSKSIYSSLPANVKWNYIMGVDLGYDDSDAIAVLAWSPQVPQTYLVEESINKKQGITELVEQINDLRTRYNVSKIVIDQGGLGKKIAEELSRRYKLPVTAAEKQRKIEYIELMNDHLRSGKLLAKANSRFADDCMRVEWDLDKSTPDKKVVSKRFHSDICDAVLYCWRESYAYTYAEAAKKPEVGSRQWLEELEQAALEHFTAQEEANKDPYKF